MVDAKAKIEEIKAKKNELTLPELEKLLNSAMEEKDLEELKKAIRVNISTLVIYLCE